jgi:hypothetical protein
VQLSPSILAALCCLVPVTTFHPLAAVSITRSQWSPFAFAICGCVALLGISLWWHDSINPPQAAIAFIAPICQMSMLRLGYGIFIRRLGRMPHDVYLNWTPGLFIDRAFTMAMFFSTLVPFVLLSAR